MTRGRGKFKPQRGGPRRFTSTRDPDAYVRHRPSSSSEDGVTSDSESVHSQASQDEGEVEEVTRGVKNVQLNKKAIQKQKEERVEESSSEEEEVKDQKPATPIATSAAVKKASDAPRELSRREKEAIEKERARQHFLKMKEKEDAARLAVIRKRREEESARAAAEAKAKEEASMRRR